MVAPVIDVAVGFLVLETCCCCAEFSLVLCDGEKEDEEDVAVAVDTERQTEV